MSEADRSEGAFDVVTGKLKLTGRVRRLLRPTPFQGIFTKLLHEDPDTFHRFVDSLSNEPLTDEQIARRESMREKLMGNIDAHHKLHANQPHEPELN